MHVSLNCFFSNTRRQNCEENIVWIAPPLEYDKIYSYISFHYMFYTVSHNFIDRGENKNLFEIIFVYFLYLNENMSKWKYFFI